MNVGRQKMILFLLVDVKVICQLTMPIFCLYLAEIKHASLDCSLPIEPQRRRQFLQSLTRNLTSQVKFSFDF